MNGIASITDYEYYRNELHMRIGQCCKMVLEDIRLSISDRFSLSFSVILNSFLLF